jgi:hypothetical protein
MASDVLDLVVAREQVDILRQAGLSPIVDAAMGNDDICFPTRKRTTVGQLSKQMSVPQNMIKLALEDGRKLLAGSEPTAPKPPAKPSSESNHYLDADALAALIRGNTNNRNRRKIAAALYVMAHKLRLTFKGDRHELEDAASNAALIALRRLHKCNPKRTGKDIFSFFSEVMRKEIVHHMHRQRQRRSKIESLEKYIDGQVRRKIL